METCMGPDALGRSQWKDGKRGAAAERRWLMLGWLPQPHRAAAAAAKLPLNNRLLVFGLLRWGILGKKRQLSLGMRHLFVVR